MNENVKVYTREDLVKWAQGMPISKVEDFHIRGGLGDFAKAHRVELHIDGQVRVLKDRFGTEGQTS